MLTDLNLEVHYYPLMVSLDKCNGSCNTLDDLSSKIYCDVEDWRCNIKSFDTRDKWIKISYSCKFKSEGRKYDLNQNWNNNKCPYQCKNPVKNCIWKYIYIYIYIWNSSACT